MRYLILSVPTLLLSLFVVAQKKNGKTGQEKYDADLRAGLQKSVDALAAYPINGNLSTSTAYFASASKNIGLQPLDSADYLQTFTLDLGKEIKPATSLKINGVPLQTGNDYWPFPFCPNISFSGTVVWGAAETNQPFLYDIKPLIEKKQKISTAGLIQQIKTKAADLSAKNISALICYNSSEINDSLYFSTTDTTETTAVPILYFTKPGIEKLKKESTIAAAIDATISLGENIYNGTNASAFLNNSAANTIVIATTGSNNISCALSLELARILKETCSANKKNTTGLNSANYLKNNYLFIHLSGDFKNNYGSDYFFDHLNSGLAKINYALNIDVNAAQKDTAGFFLMAAATPPFAWHPILQSCNQITVKTDSSFLDVNKTFYKKGIPNLYLFNALNEDRKILINKNDIMTVHYILQLIDNAGNYGKLPFNKKTDEDLVK